MTLTDTVPDTESWINDYVTAIARDWDIAAIYDPVIDADVGAAFPDRAGEDTFRRLLLGSITENLTVLRDHLALAGRVRLTEGMLKRPVEFARTQAELGVPRASLQRSYRVGLQVLWADWSEWLTSCVRRDNVDPAVGHLALQRSTAQILKWFDFVMATVDDAYARQDEALRQSGAKARDALVREILAGGLPSQPEDLYYTLRYDLSAVHVTVRLHQISDNEARNIGAALAAAAKSPNFLVTRMGLDEVVIWLGRLDRWTRPQQDAVAAGLRKARLQAAISGPSQGVAGFRSGYRDVSRAETVRQFWTEAPEVLRFADVRLEALLLTDIESARQFVIDELGPLADPTPASARMRETLLASLSARSHVDAAEQLRLHEHTVRNRLRRAEAILGNRLTDRRIELQVALRLQRLLI